MTDVIISLQERDILWFMRSICGSLSLEFTWQLLRILLSDIDERTQLNHTILSVPTPQMVLVLQLKTNIRKQYFTKPASRSLAVWSTLPLSCFHKHSSSLVPMEWIAALYSFALANLTERIASFLSSSFPQRSSAKGSVEPNSKKAHYNSYKTSQMTEDHSSHACTADTRARY